MLGITLLIVAKPNIARAMSRRVEALPRCSLQTIPTNILCTKVLTVEHLKVFAIKRAILPSDPRKSQPSHDTNAF